MMPKKEPKKKQPKYTIHKYSVVLFGDEEFENKVFDCIPDLWFVDETRTTCKWPQKSGKLVSLRAINCEKPDDDWKICECKVISEGHLTYNSGLKIVNEKCAQRYNTSSADEHIQAAAFRRKHPGLIDENIEHVFVKPVPNENVKLIQENVSEKTVEHVNSSAETVEKLVSGKSVKASSNKCSLISSSDNRSRSSRSRPKRSASRSKSKSILSGIRALSGSEKKSKSRSVSIARSRPPSSRLTSCRSRSSSRSSSCSGRCLIVGNGKCRTDEKKCSKNSSKNSNNNMRDVRSNHARSIQSRTSRSRSIHTISSRFRSTSSRSSRSRSNKLGPKCPTPKPSRSGFSTSTRRSRSKQSRSSRSRSNQPRRSHSRSIQPRQSHSRSKQSRSSRSRSKQSRSSRSRSNQPLRSHSRSNQPRRSHSRSDKTRPSHSRSNKTRPSHSRSNQTRPKHFRSNQQPSRSRLIQSRSNNFGSTQSPSRFGSNNSRCGFSPFNRQRSNNGFSIQKSQSMYEDTRRVRGKVLSSCKGKMVSTSRKNENLEVSVHSVQDLKTDIKELTKASREINNRLTENDRRFNRMEVTINKIFTMLRDMNGYNGRIHSESENDQDFDVPNLPIARMTELSIVSRKLKDKEFRTFWLKREKNFCCPTKTSTDTVTVTKYLKRFISVNVRCKLTLKETGNTGLTLFGDYHRVYLFLIDVIRDGYSSCNKKITHDDAHTALRIVWGRSKQLQKEENSKR